MDIINNTWQLEDNNEWKIILFFNHIKYCIENHITQDGMKEYYTFRELSNYLDMDIMTVSKTIKRLESKKLVQIITGMDNKTQIVVLT